MTRYSNLPSPLLRGQEWQFVPWHSLEFDSEDEALDAASEQEQGGRQQWWIVNDILAAAAAQFARNDEKAWSRLKGLFCHRLRCHERLVQWRTQCAQAFDADHRWPDIPHTIYLRCVQFPYPLAILGEAVLGDEVWSTRRIAQARPDHENHSKGAVLFDEQAAQLTVRQQDNLTIFSVEITLAADELPPFSLPDAPLPVIISLWDALPQEKDRRADIALLWPQFTVPVPFAELQSGQYFVWHGSCLYERRDVAGHNAYRTDPTPEAVDFEPQEMVWIEGELLSSCKGDQHEKSQET